MQIFFLTALWLRTLVLPRLSRDAAWLKPLLIEFKEADILSASLLEKRLFLRLYGLFGG